jgi:hypothetical protein
MSEFKIDKNVPMPATRSAGRHATFPWRSMEIGDSFFVTPDQIPSKYVSRRAWAASKLTGLKFITRRSDGGARVWRAE